MPDQQINPPEMKHAAPAWLHILWDELLEYLREVRIVLVQGGDIVDAPGGGKMIIVSPADNLPRFPALASVQGQIHEVELFGRVTDEEE